MPVINGHLLQISIFFRNTLRKRPEKIRNFWIHSHAPSIRSYRGTKLVWPDFQPMRVTEEPVWIHLFRQNPVFNSLHLKSPVHVLPPLKTGGAVSTTATMLATLAPPDKSQEDGAALVEAAEATARSWWTPEWICPERWLESKSNETYGWCVRQLHVCWQAAWQLMELSTRREPLGWRRRWCHGQDPSYVGG